MPSHTGATVFIITSRSRESSISAKRMPRPRSKPSMITYIISPKAMITPQMIDRSMP
ncbi:hypothetical protein D3C76_1436630 [compost metagenome]